MTARPFMRLVLPALSLGALAPLAVPQTTHGPREGVPDAVGLAAAVPLAFVENRGQWDTPARFVAKKGPLVARAEADAFVIQLQRRDDESSGQTLVTRLAFEGAREDVELVGEGQQRGFYNYFLGDDPDTWRSGVPGYTSVLYKGLHEGIDMRLREHQGRLEYDLLLEPGADLCQFVVRGDGISGLTIEEDGSLVMETELGPIRQSPPTTWNVLPGGEHHPVECRFVVLGERRFGFVLEDPLAGLPVVIDPGLEWATYLGGSLNDSAWAASLDGQGHVVVGGSSRSINFPTHAGAYQPTKSGEEDAFVAKLDPSQSGANQLVWSTFLGGPKRERIIDLALDPGDNVFVVGGTQSKKFPTTPGGYSRTHGGGWEAFVSQLSSDGTTLTASTFLGGDQADIAQSIAFDGLGEVVVGGSTVSANFPTTGNAMQPSSGGIRDYFFTRLDLGLSGLSYSTYLGGSANEGWIDGTFNDRVVMDIAVDGEMLSVTGNSTSTDYPTTSNAYDTTHNLVDDVIVARIDLGVSGPDGLVYSTFVGGSNFDYGVAIAVDEHGVMTVGGFSRSVNFPTTDGALQPDHPGVPGLNYHACVLLRLDPGAAPANQLLYSTFFGGERWNNVLTLALDDEDNVIAVGHTGFASMTNDLFPTTCGAYQESYQDQADGFVAYLSLSGKRASDLLYSTYIGGSGQERLIGMDVIPGGAPTVIAVGESNSVDFPTQDSYQGSNQGQIDAVAIQLELNPHTFCAAEPNSAGPDGALICGSGSVVIADNDLTLSVRGLPTNRDGYFLLSATRDYVPGFGGGNGTLCLGAPQVRFAKDVLNSGATGNVSLKLDLNNLPQNTVVLPGETWYFQYWYRDVYPGTTSNTSNGLAVTFH